MQKNYLAWLSLLALFLFTTLSFAAGNPNGKYVGSSYQAVGKPVALNQMGIYPTEILVINNTPDTISVSVPYTDLYDYLDGNAVYRVTSDILFTTTKVVVGNPYYGYFTNYVSNHSIISFSEQYGAGHVIVIEYY